MALQLYDVSVANFLQTLGAVEGFLQKGLDHFTEAKLDPNEVVGVRLYDDMLPFAFQIVSVAHHSLHAIEACKSGQAGPPGAMGELNYQGLQKIAADATAGLKALSRDEVNALEGRDVVFKLGPANLPFTAGNFLPSFPLPNFYFPATTAYDILRMKGVNLGKRNFMGAMRLKA